MKEIKHEIYGPISNWDVSKITNMSELFANKSNFNRILTMDVSNVTNMNLCFLS